MKQPTNAADPSPLKRAFLALEKMEAELQLFKYKQHEPIAIVGMGCCYPGASDSPARFWQNLLAGFDAIGELPAARAADLRNSQGRNAHNTANGQRGSFLAQVDGFDPAFFGLAPREVLVMDPAHRLLLETVWQALEEANIVPTTLFNSDMGVFIGGGTSDYLQYCSHLSGDLYTATGNVASTAAGRISYLLGITGPCVAIDTACSSSLVAIHLACQSLRKGECTTALAGGVNLLLDEAFTAMFANGNMLSAEARCKTFDAAADGYVRGEGCGMLVLKRLSDAQAAQDPIVAVIRGTAINQDGPSGGLTIPSGPSQEQVIRRALRDANVKPEQIGYIEAHGTGTPLGDPIEIGALSTVFKGRTAPLYVGSVKTNLGHLEMAAGVVGLMKLALALQHGVIPPHLHLQTPNPHIDWTTSPVQVPTVVTPWPRPADGGERMGGISSFGFSGTNAHIVVAEAPPHPIPPQFGEGAGRGQESGYHLLTISAKTTGALQAYAQRYLDFLSTHADLNLGDLCYTSHVGRSHYPHRLGLTASSLTALQQQLTDYLATSEALGLSQGVVSATQAPAKIAFLFTGQGAQYVNMGRTLYATDATFRATLDRCEALYREYTGESLLAVLYPEQKTEDRAQAPDLDAQSKIQNQKSKIDDTTYTQPALFALEYALATLWQSWGIQPDFLIGHSVGEVAAACVAGVFSLADGIKLMAARGRLMGTLPQDGAMIAVTATIADVERAITAYAAETELVEVAIAAINGPTSIVISGQRDAINAIAAVLTAETDTDTGSTIQNPKLKIKNLNVSHAFHSPLMEPMLDAFRQVAESITYHPPKQRLISNLTGKLAGAEVATPAYWVRHVREAVRFADGVATLQAQGVDTFLEIGPKPTLLGMVEPILDAEQPAVGGEIQNRAQGAPAKIQNPLLLPSLRENHPDWQQMLASLGELYVRGVLIDWAGLDRDAGAAGARRKIVLPTYPFQRQRYWVEPTAAVADDTAQTGFANWLATHSIEQLTDLVTEQRAFAESERATVTKVLSALTAESRTQQMAAQVASMLYEVAWEPQHTATAVQPPATPGRWLLLADGHGVSAALATRLTALGEQVESLPLPSADDTWADQIKQALMSAQERPLRGILHLWALDAGLTDDSRDLLLSQQRPLASVLSIIQGLATIPTPGFALPRLWLVTRGAQQLTPTEQVALAQTPLWGLGRVIALEHGDVWGGLIDVDGQAEPTVCAAALLAEILQAAPDGETEVAYRHQTRHVARLVRATAAQPTAAPLGIDPDALYLITGGLGALGLLVAEWLADQGATRLLLTGRRGVTTTAQQAVIDRLTATGVTVALAQVDVADETAMRALFAQLAAGAAPLKGVVHTAGVLDDAILLNQQWERFVPVLASKVTGAWLLHQLTQGIALDFMLFFSSLTALLGNPGQGNYAAANAFLDGLARYRQQQGLPALSINWGAWAEVGMAARANQGAFAAGQAMPPALGMAALSHVVRTYGVGQIAVAALDWPRIAQADHQPQRIYANFVTPVVPAKTKATLVQALASLPVDQRAAHLRRALQEAVVRVLGLREPPAHTTGFTDLGMDSLMALELRRHWERELDRPLPTTIAFEYPTVEKLATYLLDEQLALATPTPPRPLLEGGRREDVGVAEPIAVISMACRFPGADSPEAFWQLLCNGVDMVQVVPASRWPVDAYYDPQRPRPGKMYTREAALIDAVDQFDPFFFGIAPREANGMDPQHRLLLETSWEALERAGFVPGTLIESQTGVFIGIGEGDYGALSNDAMTALDTYAATNSGHSVAAGRLAYTLGLQGPTLAVDTACSSSLVALHLACQSLRTGECDLALAGGVNLILAPVAHIALSQMQALSPDGRCKTFDAAADGYGRGEGGGVVLLKRLSAAERDGDPILAVIKGSAVNHDGPSSGLTVPNKLAQEKLLRQALVNAGMTPDAIAYIEAHGTGTPLGDPIELRALNAVFGNERTTPLLVGSVKTNVGHLEAAAGMVGFMKTVLALQHQQIPPHLHFHTPTPHLAWDELAIQVPTALQPWPLAPLAAGVSSFGISGTNAHVIVAAAEGVQSSEDRGQKTENRKQKIENRRQIEDREEELAQQERPRHLLTLAAKSAAALPALAARYRTHLQAYPDLALGDLCYSAAVGRSQFNQRLAIVASDQADLAAKLQAVEAGSDSIGIVRGTVMQAPPRIAFLFTGQGAQYVNMGRELYATQPLFRATLDRCEALYQAYTGESLLAVLYPETRDTRHETRDTQHATRNTLDDTTYTQPALFALEYALATLWQSWGVGSPLGAAVLIGHSVGEVAAACVAGVFSLADGLKLIAARGRLMGALPHDGAMIAVTASEAEVQRAITPYADRVAIAAVNGPESIVISGQRDAVNAVAATLTAEDGAIPNRAQRAPAKIKNLTVSHAFHSPLMDPMLDDFRQVAQNITYHAPKLPLVSNVTGQLAGAEIMTADYWVRHVRDAVRFADGLATLAEQEIDICLEIGPKPVLLGMAQAIFEDGWGSVDSEGSDPKSKIQNQKSKIFLPSLREHQSDWQQMLTSLGALYVHGVPIDWAGFDQDAGAPRVRRKVLLPTYPFQRQRYWLDTSQSQRGSNALSPLLDKIVQLPATQETLFETAMSAATLPFLRDHRVDETIVAPGACHLAMVLNAAALALTPETRDGQSLRLLDVIFPQALAIGDDETRTAQLLLTPTHSDDQQPTVRFQLLSFTQAATGTAPVTTLHAQGSVHPTSMATPTPLPLSALQARCSAAADLEALLAAAASPLVFGPTFRWLEAAWHAPDLAGEVLTRLRRPAAVTTLAGYPIHPGLLDACFQTPGLVPLFAAQPGELWLPFAVAALQLEGVEQAPTAESWWCHTEQIGAQTWNIRLFDEQGQLLAAIDGFQLRATPPTAIGSAALRTNWLQSITWQATPLPPAPTAPALPTCWLIVGQAEALGTALAATARPVYQLAPGAALQPTLAEIAAHQQSVGVIYLGDPATVAATSPDVPTQAAQLCGDLLQLTQALLATDLAAHLWVVTSGCQQPTPTATITAVAAGALWGLGRTIAQEQPQLHCVCLDLDQTAATWAQHLVDEVVAGWDRAPVDGQVAYADGTRYVAHLTPWQPPVAPHQNQPMRLQLQAYGALDHLAFVPLTRRRPAAGEIEIEVKAVGLNFRDVLNALGLLQEYYATVLGITQASEVGLGFECAGVITAVGDGVTQFVVGDRVMGLATSEGAFASYLTVPAVQMTVIPDAINTVEAATLPMAFLTAWYGLVEQARLQAGEWVLIHAASGGVGQAAVQIAQALGAQVIATASPGKWDWLRRQGIAHVLNSRTLAFADEVMALTGEAGVAVVLNSLNGDFIERSLAALGHAGRFVEIGKIGIWTQEQVATQRPDAHYYPFDLGEVVTADPTVYARLWPALTTRVQVSTFRPLPQTVFPVTETVAAFRYMQQAKQVGKIVVDFAQPVAVTVQAQATYLITGGLGALGLQIAHQLVAAGARQLVLTGRQGVTTDTQRQALAALTEAGANVVVVPADIADGTAVKTLLDHCTTLAPLRGIVHAAGVLDDGILTAQTPVRLATVMRPKVAGAWHLHMLSLDLELDFFICFSSAAALLGSAGQSTYAAANAFMDTLMQQRRQQGLPGLSINWGPWADAGMAAGLQTKMAAQGLTMISAQQGRQLFQYLLERVGYTGGQMGVIPLKQASAVSQTHSRRAASRDLRAELLDLPTGERISRLEEYLRREIATVLGLPATVVIDARTRLFDVGMDSLMAVELKNRIEAGLRCAVRATLLFDYPTLEVLAPYLLKEVLKLPERQAQPQRPVTVPGRTSQKDAPPAATTGHEAIAIIGLACHYPGGVDTPAAFWQQLVAGFDGISDLPQTRAVDLGLTAQTNPLAYALRGGFLAQVDGFDPAFFGLSPREVVVMDPAHRLLLETAWQALEDANLIPAQLFNQEIGVFVGGGVSGYLPAGTEQTNIYAATGNTASTAAGRLSYLFGFTGPAMAIDTACSSSLVAVHLACQSLRNRECDAALAGGVNLILDQETTTMFASGNLLSSDARCKTFDAAANGYVRGEGCGLLVLKRLADAEADGDRIVAVIRGTAVNQDGPSSGLTVPNGPAQERVIRRALADAGVEPAQVSYIEAHGTGTPLGDPIEIGALSAVFHERTAPLYVGSVKTNIGHLEAAAGVAGLMKLVLALYHRQIPPHLHLHTPNPHIDWAAIPVQVPTTLTDWTCPTGVDTRIGGVSSFGFSGTNAHVVVEEAPEVERKTEDRGQRTEGRTHHLLTIAAKSAEALQAYAGHYLALLHEQPTLNLGELCYAAQTGRSHFAYRLGLVAASGEDLQSQLRAYATGEASASLSQGQVAANQATPKIAFLFTGQGAQYLQMGRDLYAQAPVFRDVIDRCDTVMQAVLGRSLLDLIYPATAPDHQDLMTSHPCGQAVNFALACALADLWRAWGVQPTLVLGHSLGDFAAAYTAGVLALEDGMRLVIERGRLMEQALGSMVSVLGTEAEVAPFLADFTDVTIGVINGPKSVVISGGHDHVATVTAQLQAAGFKTRKLDIPVAAHSPMLDPVLTAFEAAVRRVQLTPPQIRVVSSMTGKLVTTELTDPAYWRQHLRNTVRFADGVMTLLAQDVDLFIEIGPKPTLLSLAEQVLDTVTGWQGDKVTASPLHPLTPSPAHPLMLPSLRENQPDWRQMLTSLSALYVRGVAINWAGVDQGRPLATGVRRPVTLPTYPFQRQRYWLAPQPGAGQGRARQAGLRPLLDKMTKVPRRQETIFETAFSVETLPFLADHRVYGAVISPGACQLALVLSAADLLFGRTAQGLCLENIILPQALVLPEEASRTVQTILSGHSDKKRGATAPQYDFEVISFGLEESETEPASHAGGMVTTRLPVASSEPATASLDHLRQRCDQTVDIELFYRTMRAAQIEFGPSFQWLGEAWQGGAETTEALARLVLPATLTPPTDHLLHPGLLDACFQVAGLARSSEQNEETLLPFAVERLSLYTVHPMQTGEWWCHAVKRDERKWDMRLLDEQGQLLVYVEGYEVRSAPAETVRGADLWRDWLYQIKWQPNTYFGLLPDYLPAPAAIAPTLRAQLPALWQAAGGEQTQALHTDLDRLSLAYVVAAFTNTGFTFQPGVQWPTTRLAQQVGVIPTYRRLFQRLLSLLAEEGILRRDQELWEVLRVPEVADTVTTLEAGQRTAEHAPEYQLLRRCGPQLSAVLRGAQEPLALLFPGGDDTITAALYRASPGAQVMNTLIAHLVQQALDQLPAARGIRILEIGAGTGGTTATLLPRLPSDRTDYCFTDIGPTFLAQAQVRFANYDFVRYQPLDIERSPMTQGFATQQADLVIAANVLHATQDLAVTLAHVRALLQPGGQLVLLETTSPSRWVDLTFGLTDGWWRFADARQEHPLLSADQWQRLLQAAGFPAVEIIEQDGQAVIIARSATSTSSVTGRTETAQTPAEPVVAPAEPVEADAWLIFADAQGVGAALADQLQQRGARTQLVYQGQAYEVVDEQTLHLQPACAADYQRLLATYPTTRGIVYLWGLDTLQPGTETDLVAATQLGCGAALHLVQALLQTGTTPAGLWLVTQEAQAVSAGDSAQGYSQAPLWGLGRVLAQEHPELPCVCVDLAGAAVAPALHAAQLCAEVYNREEPAAQVALRPEARYVARLSRFTPTPQPSLVCDPAATYLITGGLSGIGLATAAWLTTQGAQHLLLVGRSQPKPAAQAALDALMAQGVTVTVAQCDVTERAQVERLLAGIEAAHPLRGIIHSVGVLDDGALLQQSWARFATVLAPKVQGIWHLHRLTSGMMLDFFVLYSSAAGLLGSRGQANHAAANAFLDAFAHYRQGQGLPALSINWGAWSEIGSAAAFVKQSSNAARGYRAIPPDLGIAALAGLLPQPTPQVGVIPFDWRNFQPETAAERAFYAEFFAQTPEAATAAPTTASSQPSIREQLATATPQAAEALLTAYLQQEVAQILHMTGLPNPTSGFHEIGMDSLMTIELRRRLEKGLAVTLPSTIVFEYPTVALLRQYLVQEVLRLTSTPTMLPPNGQHAMPEAATGQPADDAEPMNAELDALSDAELNALLAQELAMLEE